MMLIWSWLARLSCIAYAKLYCHIDDLTDRIRYSVVKYWFYCVLTLFICKHGYLAKVLKHEMRHCRSPQRR